MVLHVKGYSNSDVEQISVDLTTTALTEMDEETQMALATGDEEATMKFMQQFMKDYVAAVAAMEPTVDTDITVKCEKLKLDVSGKQKVAWLPSDMTKFESDVEASIMK